MEIFRYRSDLKKNIMKWEVIQYFQHGGHEEKSPNGIAIKCVISLQIANQKDNFSILRGRLSQVKFNYQNPP